jgi:hypothetical protein
LRGIGILPMVHGQDAHATEIPCGVTTNKGWHRQAKLGDGLTQDGTIAKASGLDDATRFVFAGL